MEWDLDEKPKMGRMEGWRIREIPNHSPEYRDYIEKGAKWLKENRRIDPPKIPTHFNGKLIADLSSSEKEAFYISMQTPNTQKLLLRDPKDDADWQARLQGPMPEGWKAIPEADMSTEAGRDKGVAKRAVDVAEFQIIDGMRQSGHANTFAQGDGSILTSENRKRAIEAFTYSKPADLSQEDLRRITHLKEIANTPPEPEEETKGFFSKIMGFFAKGEVKAKKTEMKLIGKTGDSFGITYHYEDSNEK